MGESVFYTKHKLIIIFNDVYDVLLILESSQASKISLPTPYAKLVELFLVLKINQLLHQIMSEKVTNKLAGWLNKLVLYCHVMGS